MTEADSGSDFKFKSTLKQGGAFTAYRSLYYGHSSLWQLIRSELIVTLTSGIPGALGLVLRKGLYPRLFKSTGRKVVFGRNITLRHAHKITLGDNVVIDDGVVLDAKGETNEGITIGDNVYIGRNTIVYCKNGNIRIGKAVNISSNCQIFSSNDLSIGAGTVVAAFTYMLSGGQYDHADPTPFAEQSGMVTRGPTAVGPDCWIGAHVVIVDGATIGERCVVGAGAVVTSAIPPHSLAVGTPAKVIRTI